MVARARSIGARINQGFAIGAIALVGGGFLVWYYTALAARQAEGEVAAERVTQQKSSTEMRLPPLVRPEPRQEPVPEAPLPADDGGIPEYFGNWKEPAADADIYAVPASYAPATRPEDPTLRRTLDAPVLIRPGAADLSSGTESSADQASRPQVAGGGALGANLVPTATPAVAAEVVPTRRWLLPKGSFLDCTLETAIDSTLPGMVSCVLAVDTFGLDGRVVLLERGTKLIGETRPEVRTGQRRVFVLWHEARTPTGVVATLASPGTDALGRSGVTGSVDMHSSERFGAALLLSIVDSAAATAAASQQDSGATVVISPQGSQDVLAEVVRQTGDIPPTIRVPPGARLQVYVARNVDFRSVYSLRARER